MNGITVSVSYGDLLAVTLPANAPHFEQVLVITAPHDEETQRVVANVKNARLHVTDAFYRRGAEFNKGAALEEGFDVLGREGWILVWDADILFPERMPLANVEGGCLYSCHRRIVADPTWWRPGDDTDWEWFPRRQEEEMAGYFHLFHADDEVLEARPWYEGAWRHAGGADSMFQRKWPECLKFRLDFDVLHLGEPDKNWFGRATKRMDGTVPEGSEEKIKQLRALFDKRHQTRHMGQSRRFEDERLPEG